MEMRGLGQVYVKCIGVISIFVWLHWFVVVF